MAMFKIKNKGTENGMRETRRMGKYYFSGNIIKVSEHSGNVAKYSGGCRQTFREMLVNIPGNAPKQILIHKFKQFIITIYENREVCSFQ